MSSSLLSFLNTVKCGMWDDISICALTIFAVILDYLGRLVLASLYSGNNSRCQSETQYHLIDPHTH